MDSHFNQGGQSAAYHQVNVNRTKARKWVEARVQSYDSDDWGVDEYSEPEVPQPPDPPRFGSPVRERRVSKPPLIRPSDIYRRMEEDRQRERGSADSSQPSGDGARVTDTETAARAGAEGEPHGDRLSPKLPDLARLSVFGSDLFGRPEGHGDGFNRAEASPLPAAAEETAKTEPPSKQPQPAEDASENHTYRASPGPAGENQNHRASPSPAEPTPTVPALRPDGVVPPLRTPSPRIPSASAGQDAGSATGQDAQGALPMQPKTTFDTVTSSPAKDDDALSDEILRSLSPAGDAKRNTVRGSSYTLRDYDSYWADSERRGSTAVPPVPAVPESSAADAPEPDGNAPAPDSPELHRRFSWQIGDEEPAAEMRHGPPSTGADDAEASVAQAPVPGTMAALEPPSPVSAVSDGQALARASPGNRASLDQALSSLGSPMPPSEPHAALARAPTSGGQAPSVMTFREILGMARPADRIAKYNETRDYFASSESGLEAWLAGLQAQHPEHGGHAAARQAPAAAQVPAKQPYYQQYLNASSPSSGASPSSRSRPGQQTASPGGSAFGHSNQLGTKSKELMHSAGKMGKGLLSKGKNKVRGSGDKVFH